MIDVIDRLVKLGFSEYEAKAYVALLRESPVTGYQLSKASGVPRSMIYEVLGKLTARGAALTVRMGSSTQYAPVPASDFLDQLLGEQEQLVAALKEDLSGVAAAPDLEYVWNIEGDDNVRAKAVEMIGQAGSRIYMALRPAMFPELRKALEAAITRGVRVGIYATGPVDLPGAQVTVAPLSEEAVGRMEGLRFVLVVDGREVLISEWFAGTEAHASWTSSPLLVFMAEHHLRTDPYLPEVLDCLGERASEIIREEDRELFARAMESRIEE